MAKETKTCRVCGKQYKACRTEMNGVFRWQDVACCPEHGLEYFRRVELSRTVETAENVPAENTDDNTESVEEVAAEYPDMDDEAEEDEYVCGIDEEDTEEE